MFSKRPHGDGTLSRSKRSIESGSTPKSPFVDGNAEYRFSIFRKKNIIYGRSVVLHLNIPLMIESVDLKYFLQVKEHIYPDLAILFYSNISFSNNLIHSRVDSTDINMHMNVFA